jgi:hypothetical protein
MMVWTPTKRRSAVSGAARLLARRAWRESEHGTALREVIAAALDAEDRVLRHHAAYGVRQIADGDSAALDLIRDRLLVEEEPDVAAVLVHQLRDMVAVEPETIDRLLADLLAVPLWRERIASTDNDVVESLSSLVALILRLAIAEETPMAVTAAAELFNLPVGRPVAQRGISLIRSWLALPSDRMVERRRAFAIVLSAARAIEMLRQTTDDPNETVDLYKMADAIVMQICFASGAYINEDGAHTSVPAQDGFIDEALPVLETIRHFREPSIVHHVVQTLEHLVAGDPKQCFLILARAVEAGDAYTFDSMAADTTVALVGRFVSEYRELLADDPELLTAVRRVLSAFAKVGWPAAVMLASHLGDAFR